jgi:hypothetical protein
MDYLLFAKNTLTKAFQDIGMDLTIDDGNIYLSNEEKVIEITTNEDMLIVSIA